MVTILYLVPLPTYAIWLKGHENAGPDSSSILTDPGYIALSFVGYCTVTNLAKFRQEIMKHFVAGLWSFIMSFFFQHFFTRSFGFKKSFHKTQKVCNKKKFFAYINIQVWELSPKYTYYQNMVDLLHHLCFNPSLLMYTFQTLPLIFRGESLYLA